MNTTSPSSAVLASLAGAVKRYGERTVLDDVALEVRGGELLALLGPNGAGKSTAVSLLLGLVEADGGEALLCGASPRSLAARRSAGVMLQEAELPAVLRVGELIRLTAAYYADPLSLDEAARLAAVEDLLDRPYGKLSGGQKRRAQFALAICGRPRIVFLDEPTTGLDVEARAALWRAVRGLVENGSGVLLTTHYLEEAEALADRVVVLDQGRVKAEGSVDAIRARAGRRRIRCRSALSPEAVLGWPETAKAEAADGWLHLEADDAEGLLRRLLAADPSLAELEVRRAGLAEAFVEITRKAAA